MWWAPGNGEGIRERVVTLGLLGNSTEGSCIMCWASGSQMSTIDCKNGPNSPLHHHSLLYPFSLQCDFAAFPTIKEESFYTSWICLKVWFALDSWIWQKWQCASVEVKPQDITPPSPSFFFLSLPRKDPQTSLLQDDNWSDIPDAQYVRTPLQPTQINEWTLLNLV